MIVAVIWLLIIVGYDHRTTVEQYPTKDICLIARWGRVNVRDTYCVDP